MSGGSYTAGAFNQRSRMISKGGRGTVRNFQAAGNSTWVNYLKGVAQQTGRPYATLPGDPQVRQAYYADVHGTAPPPVKPRARKNPRPKGRQLMKNGNYKIYVRAPRESDIKSGQRLVNLAYQRKQQGLGRNGLPRVKRER